LWLLCVLLSFWVNYGKTEQGPLFSLTDQAPNGRVEIAGRATGGAEEKKPKMAVSTVATRPTRATRRRERKAETEEVSETETESTTTPESKQPKGTPGANFKEYSRLQPLYRRPRHSILKSLFDSLDQFGRKLIWKLYFSNNGNNNATAKDTFYLIPPIKGNKSLPLERTEWMQDIDFYIQSCKIKCSAVKRLSNPLSDVQLLILRTLRSLFRREDIITKPADKNLEDRSTYELIDPHVNFAERSYHALEAILHKHEVYCPPVSKLARSIMQLRQSTAKLGHFYTLPHGIYTLFSNR